MAEVLPRGAVAAIKAAAVADESDPDAKEAFGVLLGLMRGDRLPGDRGVPAVVRLGAARDVLDRRRGKPIQSEQHTGEVVHRVVIERNDAAE